MAEKVPKSKIYTRTGDAGTTSLYNGTRCPKEDDVIEALGDVDETSASVGFARAYCETTVPELIKDLDDVMSRLMDIGSAIATPRATSPANLVERTRFPASNIEALEHRIDHFDHQLPTLKNFILPTGGLAAAALHRSRTICRRAERRVASLHHNKQVEDEVLAYLNRLSDFLFVAARFAAHKAGAPEVIYKPCSQPKQQQP